MTTNTRSLDSYLDRIKAHLLKKYPGMAFEVENVDERQAYLYCYPDIPTEDTYEITERAGNIVTDALVDDGYRIYVMTRN